MKKKVNVRDLSLMALFAALTAVGPVARTGTAQERTKENT